jgi:hypothetical protein
MAPAIKKDYPPSSNQKVYVLKGVTYVPHYSERGYVSPGFGRHNNQIISEFEMDLSEAKPQHIMLWNRTKF